MKNMQYLAIFAGITLFAAIAVLVVTSDPLVTLIGKLVVAVSLMELAAAATAYLMDRDSGFHARAMSKEELDWY